MVIPVGRGDVAVPMARDTVVVPTQLLARLVELAPASGIDPRLGLAVGGIFADWVVSTNSVFTVLSGERL